jgi:hypothetical protein
LKLVTSYAGTVTVAKAANDGSKEKIEKINASRVIKVTYAADAPYAFHLDKKTIDRLLSSLDVDPGYIFSEDMEVAMGIARLIVDHSALQFGRSMIRVLSVSLCFNNKDLVEYVWDNIDPIPRKLDLFTNKKEADKEEQEEHTRVSACEVWRENRAPRNKVNVLAVTVLTGEYSVVFKPITDEGERVRAKSLPVKSFLSKYTRADQK